MIQRIIPLPFELFVHRVPRPFPPSIKLLLISLSKLVFSLFVSLSTLSVLDSRRGTRDTEGGPTDKTRVVNSTRRKPTHLSLSTACLPETRGLLEIPTAFLACFFSVYCAGRRKSHVEIQIFCSFDKLHPRALQLPKTFNVSVHIYVQLFTYEYVCNRVFEH